MYPRLMAPALLSVRRFEHQPVALQIALLEGVDRTPKVQTEPADVVGAIAALQMREGCGEEGKTEEDRNSERPRVCATLEL